MLCSKQKVKGFSIWFRAVRSREKTGLRRREMTVKFGEGLDPKSISNRLDKPILLANLESFCLKFSSNKLAIPLAIYHNFHFTRHM